MCVIRRSLEYPIFSINNIEDKVELQSLYSNFWIYHAYCVVCYPLQCFSGLQLLSQVIDAVQRALILQFYVIRLNSKSWI